MENRGYKLFHKITEKLPEIYDSVVTDMFKETHLLTNPDRDMILSVEREDVEALANLFNQLFGEETCYVGRYDPETDDIIDAYTGMYFVTTF